MQAIVYKEVNVKNCKAVLNYIFGNGSLAKLTEVLDGKRVGKDSYAIFVVDEFFKGEGKIVSSLPIAPNDVLIYADTKDEPKTEYIDSLVQQVRAEGKSNPVAVIGMGGGSSLDIAKAISILLRNPGKAQDYQGWNLVKNPAIYKIGIPTLSGTGAESSGTAVMTSPEKKLGMNSEFSIYDQLILDPSLTATVPKNQAFYTGMDCYIHCVESLRGSQIDALSRAYAETALQLTRECFMEEFDPAKLMVASCFGGYAIANTNVGIAHPLSYGVSLVLGYHHGIANCIIFNQIEEYYPEAVRDFKTVVAKGGYDIPKNVCTNVTEAQMNQMVQATLKNDKPLTNALGPNWRDVFTPEKVKSLFQKM